jgi:hypothetical protein
LTIPQHTQIKQLVFNIHNDSLFAIKLLANDDQVITALVVKEEKLAEKRVLYIG